MKRRLLLSILTIVGLFIITGCTSKLKDNEKIKIEETEIKYNYISNNSSNSNFEYNDTKKAELAVYEKYIARESEQILNQKIYVKIAETNTYSDESTATSKKYTAIAVDHDGNRWKIFSTDIKGNVQIYRKNIKIFGLFRGIEKTEDGSLPVLEVYTYEIDSTYLDKNEYREISNTYIDKLNEIYTKENFIFNSTEEDVSTINMLYVNNNKDIEITVKVDIDDKYVKYVETKVVPISIKFSDVDNNFWYSVIKSFNGDITSSEADTMIVTAKADAITQADADHLILTKGQPMTTGSYTFKGTKIDINLYIRQLLVQNEE